MRSPLQTLHAVKVLRLLLITDLTRCVSNDPPRCAGTGHQQVFLDSKDIYVRVVSLILRNGPL
jgi:hypothetical protein